MKLVVKEGDVLAWKRDDVPLRCDVLDVRENEFGTRARLRIEGWMGTHWMTLTGSFIPWAEYQRDLLAKAGEKLARKKLSRAA